MSLPNAGAVERRAEQSKEGVQALGSDAIKSLG